MNSKDAFINTCAIIFLIYALLGLISPCKSQSSIINKLVLKDEGFEIKNKICLQISEKEYQKLFKSKGNHMYLKSAQAIINDHPVTINELHTRGKTTLFMTRKSLSFDLDDKVTFHHHEDQVSIKKFYTVSLSMDKNYIKNRLSFAMLEKLGLFELFFTYSEIVINGVTGGIYLIVKRLQDWALKSKDSPMIIRRGFNHEIEKVKTGKKVDNEAIRIYRNVYADIYDNIAKFEGKKLFQVISQWIYLEMYMQWMAFNYFVRNGDYTDEVYLYIDSKENRFKIIPWDFDDIFAREPHEGMSQKKIVLGDKYILSSEDELDKKIAADPFLYKKYLEQLKIVLQHLDPDFLEKVFQDTYAELFPYFSRKDIIEVSCNDTFKGASLESLEFDLDNIYTQLLLTRFAYLNKLDGE